MTKVLLSPSFKQMVYIVIVNRYVFLTFFFETPDHKKNWYEIKKKINFATWRSIDWFID